MDWLKNLLGFFGINKEDEEKKKKQQTAARQPSASRPGPQMAAPTFAANTLQKASNPQQTQENVSENALNPVIFGQNVAMGLPLQKAPVKKKEEEENPLIKFGKKLVSAVQQGAGNVADTAVMGGNVLEDTAAAIRGDSPEKRAQINARYEKVRNDIKAGKTVSGESLNAREDYKPSGDFVRDALDVGGRGLQVGLDATTFANPGRVLTKAFVKEAGGKIAAKELVKGSAAIGGTQGVATAGQEYGRTGEADTAIEEGLKSGAISTGAQIALSGAGYGAGTLLRKATGRDAPVKQGVESVNPTREADAAKVQADAEAKAEQLRVAQEQAAGVEPTPNPNDPAFIRKRAAEEQQAQIDQDVLDASPPDINDIPAYQRQGKELPSIKAKQDRLAELDNVLEGAPTEANLRANEFRLRQQYAQDLNSSPSMKKEIGEKLKRNLDTLKADMDIFKAAKKERDALQKEVAESQQQTKTAQALQTENSNGTQDVVQNPTPTPAPQVPVTPPVQTQPPATGVMPIENVAPSPAVEAQPQPTITANPGELPRIPETAAPATVDIAPRTHDALVKQMGPSADVRKGVFGKKQALNLDELKQGAESVVANLDDDSLVRSFSTTGPETMITDSNSFAVARATLNRLSQSEDPAAAQTVTNILDAMDRYSSKSGEALRIVQEEFDSMPVPMKVRYIIKKIDNANAEVDGYTPLRDDPARADIIDRQITKFLTDSQTISESVSKIEGRLNEISDAAVNGQPVNYKVDTLVKELRNAKRELAEQNGELAKFYTDLLPKRARGQRVNDFARRMMLASFTGRINDLITTGANVLNLGAQNFTQGIISKAVNLVKPGKVTDTFRGARQFGQGTIEGLKKSGGEFTGKQYEGDLQKALRSTGEETRSGLRKANGPVGRTIQVATELATNISEGVRDQRLYQLAAREAEQAGLRGNDLVTYAKARAAVPSRTMIESAENLHKELNNLNANPVTQTLNRVASSIEGKSAIGGFLKNQVMPFTSWLGGNIYNSITDKNVVASFVKTIGSAARGDAEGLVRNIAKTANNAAYTYALGYLLTESGVIVNEDAEGYNDAGAYLKIGDRYIPVGFTGFLAPSLILGNAAYNGLNAEDAENPSEKIAATAENVFGNMLKSLNATSALGADNNISRSFEAMNRPGGDIADGAATFAGNAAGQFIPALAGDINAGLNNGIPGIAGSDALNPTHEKAETKVTDPNSPSGEAKDVPRSAVNTFLNRIPIVSQQLPRKAGVAAPDVLDRVTKGNRDTDTSKTTRATAEAKVDREKDFESRDIPNPEKDKFESAVQARVEAGEYGKAIEGLRAKLEMNKKDKNVPASKNAEIEKDIKKLEVTDKGKYDPSVIELYKKTNLTEWRNMGDPESDDYDPDTYQLLYDYDSDLANKGVSRSATKAERNFYSAKEVKAKKSGGGRGGRGGGGSSADSLIKGNTIGNTPDLAKISLGNLSPQKAGSIKIPTIQQMKANQLIKKRVISVKKV